MTIQEDTASRKGRIACGKSGRSVCMHACPSNDNDLRA